MSAMACPECLQGKHGNCDGSTWDDVKDDLGPCPCHRNNHLGAATEEALLGVAYPIGDAVLGETPECNGRCGYDDDDRWMPDRDCPIDGDFADQREAPQITDIDTGGRL